jgi:tricorn protease
MEEALGYYRYPTITENLIAFVCEDGVWTVPTTGGDARRLTGSAGEASFPRLSPDGKHIAFVGRDEGNPEVYVIPSGGGEAIRLTFAGSDQCMISGWTPDGSEILYTSDHKSPFVKELLPYAVRLSGGEPRSLNVGHAMSVAISPNGAVALGLNNADPARWKRYRGGTSGDLWVDAKGNGTFKRLIRLAGNPVWPMWLGGRIYFLADHEGVGNLYSCTPDGSELRRHTDHADYYVRFPSTDGHRIVYGAGAEIFVYDQTMDASQAIRISTPSNPPQIRRRFVDASARLEHYAPHQDGHAVALIARGRPATLSNWEEAVSVHGEGSRVRYRLSEWLPDGGRIVVLSDADGDEHLEIHRHDMTAPPDVVAVTGLQRGIGRAISLAAAPKADVVAIGNHRYELIVVDLKTGVGRLIDRSPAMRIEDLAWSPDGRWLAYSWSPYADAAIIKIADTESGETRAATSPLRMDVAPTFDPDGKYLYFLSTRDFNPIYDSMQFDLGFPNSVRPFALPLRRDVASPFVPAPKPVVHRALDDKKEELPSPGPMQIGIDFDGIADRVIGFPVDEGRYEWIEAAKGRALFSWFPTRGSLSIPALNADDAPSGSLIAYDFDDQRTLTLASEISSFRVAGDHRTVFYRSGDRLRAIDGLGSAPEGGERRREPGRRSGWLDLSRVSFELHPRDEWAQMYREAWRLQRDHFWDERMTGVDWQLVHDRYARLLPRIRTRAELSDVMWEMQGELGTSHAYESGGDYPGPRRYRRGFLGADLVFDKDSGGWRIERILRGDSWDRDVDSPLAEPGCAVREGDILVAINGRVLSADVSPSEVLVNEAGRDVALTIKPSGGDAVTRVLVRALRDERPLRYRAWVTRMRELVHERTSGRVGYLHIPDMGPWGFAEFHRGYLPEVNREALIVDARFNRGGHVSPLLLEKLARKRVGYDVSRWGQVLPYPPESVAGPLVALTNQFAGSDGDIFSHFFKVYRLGPLVGKRTWGGVIGIWPRHPLVDGTVTTQPEFSTWANDVGWGLENYGTDPDYDVDIAPQDAAAGKDPQMDKALELITSSLEAHPPTLPDFSKRPNLRLPDSLPPRPR